jgi:hypothetical protein
LAVWNNGLLAATDPQHVTVSWLGTNFCQFLVFFSLIGFLAQFVFRYLTLCRFDLFYIFIKNLSTKNFKN